MNRPVTLAALSVALFLGSPPGVMSQERDRMHGEHAAHQESREGTSETDLAAIRAVVDGYHAALSSGDRDTVERLLAEDVVVLESGGREDRTQYLEHHLPGDMAFAAAVERTRSELDVRVMGDVAWVSSTSSTTGSYRGRDIDSLGAELMVLAREGGEWLIRAIHWSARPNRAGS